MQAKYIACSVQWNNINTIGAAVAQALINALSGAPQPGVQPDAPIQPTPFIIPSPVCGGVTVTTVGSPSLTGINSVSIQLSVPDGTTDANIVAWVTQAINNLNLGTVGYYSSWPAMGTVIVNSVTVL
jgi:hypothetical protein